MKTYIITQSMLLIFSINIFAQNTNCNRDVWIKQDEKKIPNGICIPKGYLISNIYEMTDVNTDGFSDFIFKWRRPELQDGDTLYVTIYTQNQDSTFSHFRTFSNLFPINFESYDRDYIPKDKKLRGLHRKYDDEYPFIELSFEKESIQITRTEDAEAHLIITYKFDKAINNWRYEKSEEYFLVEEGKKPIDFSKKLGPLIDNFTYFIWEEEEE